LFSTNLKKVLTNERKGVIIILSKEREVNKMRFEEMMNARQVKREHVVREWWNENGYKVMRVVLYPLYVGYRVAEKYKEKQGEKLVWSEEQAKEVLDRNIPKICETFDSDGLEVNTRTFLWNNKMKEFARKDRKWIRKFRNQLVNYLINDYEIEGSDKEFDDCFGGYREGYVIFTEKF
jgi:hypothetical protein